MLRDETSLIGNLSTVQLAFFDLDNTSTVPCIVFEDCVALVCTQEECQFLKYVFQQPKGFIRIAQCEIAFAKGMLYGLRKKAQPLPICHVTTVNFDQVYRTLANNNNAHTLVHTAHANIVRLRQEVSVLQTKLANITFEIMLRDHERFRALKHRDKKIEQVKRAVRRTERQLRLKT